VADWPSGGGGRDGGGSSSAGAVGDNRMAKTVAGMVAVGTGRAAATGTGRSIGGRNHTVAPMRHQQLRLSTSRVVSYRVRLVSLLYK
jgi:hypothetical protein